MRCCARAGHRAVDGPCTPSCGHGRTRPARPAEPTDPARPTTPERPRGPHMSVRHSYRARLSVVPLDARAEAMLRAADHAEELNVVPLGEGTVEAAALRPSGSTAAASAARNSTMSVPA